MASTDGVLRLHEKDLRTLFSTFPDHQILLAKIPPFGHDCPQLEAYALANPWTWCQCEKELRTLINVFRAPGKFMKALQSFQQPPTFEVTDKTIMKLLDRELEEKLVHLFFITFKNVIITDLTHDILMSALVDQHHACNLPIAAEASSSQRQVVGEISQN